MKVPSPIETLAKQVELRVYLLRMWKRDVVVIADADADAYFSTRVALPAV
jgi:hypothetical protein